MNHKEFKQAVRTMRQAQKQYFLLPADNPVKEKAKESMRQAELPVWGEVDRVSAIRPQGRMPKSEQEEFFLLVADLVAAHRSWIRSRYTTDRDFARQLERKVDVWLQEDDRRIKEEKERELAKRQTRLFDEL